MDLVPSVFRETLSDIVLCVRCHSDGLVLLSWDSHHIVYGQACSLLGRWC